MNRRHNYRERGSKRHALMRGGFSLLETIFAIAILGVSLAAIGHLVQLGFRAAQIARVQSQAQILCDAKMAEIASGALPAEAANGATIDDAPNWEYSVEVEPAEQIGLLVVQVTVQQQGQDPLTFSLVRFMPDPNFDFNESTE